MSKKNLQHIRLRKFLLNTQIKRLSGVILVVMAMQLQQTNAQDLVLQDMTITTTETFSANNSITAGPNFTIASSGDVILSAPAVALKSPFFIIKGGKLRVVSQEIAVNVEIEDAAIPNEFVVHQNYPNPFNPTTKISYELPKAEKVEIVIYNIFGQKVRTIISEYQRPGYHSVIWDGTGNTGERVSSGVYYYKVTAGKYNVTKKMTFMK